MIENCLRGFFDRMFRLGSLYDLSRTVSEETVLPFWYLENGFWGGPSTGKKKKEILKEALTSPVST